MNAKVLVVGGGISGLATAYSLNREGIEVCLLERDGIAGGLIRSERKEGYLLERGPNSLLNINARLDVFCTEIRLDREKIFQNPESKSRYILKKGALVSIPRTPLEFIRTPLLSAKGKFRAALEPFVGPYRDAGLESVSDFVSRRFGREILNYVVDPLIEGIYAGDPEKLSMKATFPRLTDLEARYGSVLKGFMIRKREERREKRIDLFSFKNGMGTLPDTLSRELEKNLVRDIRIDSIGPVSSGRSGFRLQGYRNGVQQTFDAEEVVLAVPAYEAARLIAPFSERIAQELRLIEYAPVAIVNFGFSAAALKRTFTGSGCLIPKNENRLLLGFRINSNLYRGRAPSGKMIVTCFMGGMRNPGIVRESDEAITGKARLELQTLLGIEEKPEFVHLVRHLQAIPQYDMKHLQRLEVIAGELERVEGLHITGNYLKGVSIWDCISQGLDLGRRISEEQKRRAGVSN